MFIFHISFPPAQNSMPKIYQTQHNKYIKMDTEYRSVPGSWRYGKLVFNGHKISIWEDEKALEMNGGDGYTL